MDSLRTVRRRLRAQRLAGRQHRSAPTAVRSSGAVQGQELHEALWSLGQRIRGARLAEVEDALLGGEVLRVHALRPTWHLVAAEDLRWIQRLTAPRVLAGHSFYLRRSGLDDETLTRARRVVASELADGAPATRTELGAALARRGVEREGEHLGNLLLRLELEALVASGPRRGKQHTYVLADSVAPPAPQREREGDLRELVVRYFTSHGPATLRDFAWWSSLTVADARLGVELAGDGLVTERDPQGLPWFSAPDAARAVASGALMLGMYDESIVAHRDLRMVLAAGPPRPSRLERAILLDGRTVGSWRRTVARRSLTVHATLFVALDEGGRAALAEEAERFGAFHGLPTTLELSPSKLGRAPR